jgi:hypothetical protein
MTQRELFLEIMHYGTFDRMPVVHWACWPETLERWYEEGLPRDADIHQFLGVTPQWTAPGVDLGLFPHFEEEVLEETDEYRIFRDQSGVILQDWKHKSCIPHYIDFTLKTAADWPEYKKRLQPDPARIPADLDAQIQCGVQSGLPMVAWTASLMGWLRDWMGVENMSYLFYDDREVYADMVDTIADLVCWGLDQTLPKAQYDMGFGWEDICGRSGPLVSPNIFDECVAPGYRKIRAKLEEYGIKLYGIDSDGEISALIGHWLEAGVNVQFPIEVGPFKGDALAYRKKYGKELRVIGNFDKLTLEKGRDEVEAELTRLMPLMKEGGFMMMPDHLITPGVSLEMYRWFLDRWSRIRL